MPNIINASGLTTKTRAELVAELNAGFQSVYGADINLDPDSPDGQIIGIFVQAILDLEDLLTQIYNTFDPDNAIGNVLDQRVAINGIQRQAGTYTVTPITVTVSQAVTLPGLDQDTEVPFTVEDNAGNKWILRETQTPSVAGDYVYSFRAETPGANLTVPNTITIPVTIIIGVSAVNNPTTYTTLGLNEETDAELRLRRQKSVSLSSQGYLAGLLAALLNINGVIDAIVYENVTGLVDANGVPGHSIWVIISGSGEDSEIAEAIYTKRNAGCGMKGDIEFAVDQADGTQFIVRWDDVEAEDLYIEFTVQSISGEDTPDAAAIKAYLVENFVPGVAATVDINHLASVVQAYDEDALVTLAGFSTAAIGPFTATLEPSAKNKQFSVSAANIDVTVV